MSELTITTSHERQGIIRCLKRSLIGSRNFSRTGPSGEFGFRVTDGTATYEFILSYDDNCLYIFNEDGTIGEFRIFGWPTEIEAVLRAANIPIPGEIPSP